MKAVILAAGTGTRLLPLTREVPKCLVSVNGRTILERIVENCLSLSIDEFVVVGGHKKDNLLKAMDALGGVHRTRFECVENPDYRTTNTGVSLNIALRGATDDLLVINGDNVFDRRILRDLLKPSQTAIAIDNTKSLNEESFKVRIQDNVVALMGKQIPIDQANGEFIGISLLRKGDLDTFRGLLGGLIDRNPMTYYDFAFQELSAIRPVVFAYTNGLKWTEVDTPDDLRAAGGLAASFDTPGALSTSEDR
jgi:choline kinase